MPTIAQFLKDYRTTHKLSVYGLVARTGILPQTIQQIEAGRGSPHMTTVQKLIAAKVLPANLKGITFPERKRRAPPSSPALPPVEPPSAGQGA